MDRQYREKYISSQREASIPTVGYPFARTGAEALRNGKAYLAHRWLSATLFLHGSDYHRPLAMENALMMGETQQASCHRTISPSLPNPRRKWGCLKHPLSLVQARARPLPTQ